MSYIDWGFYSSLFNNVSAEEFPQLCARAERKLDAYTHYRAKNFVKNYNAETATEFEKQVMEQIKDAVCELINWMQDIDSSAVGKGIASVSNDGYSETYKVTTTAEMEVEAISIVHKWLAGTGLAGAL